MSDSSKTPLGMGLTALFGVLAAIGLVDGCYTIFHNIFSDFSLSITSRILTVAVAVAALIAICLAVFLVKRCKDVLTQTPPAGISESAAIIIKQFTEEVLPKSRARVWCEIDTATGIGAKVWLMRYAMRLLANLAKRTEVLRVEIAQYKDNYAEPFNDLYIRCRVLDKQIQSFDDSLTGTLSFIEKLSSEETKGADNLLAARKLVAGVGDELRRLAEEASQGDAVPRKELRQQLAQLSEELTSAYQILINNSKLISREADKCCDMLVKLRRKWRLSG